MNCVSKFHRDIKIIKKDNDVFTSNFFDFIPYLFVSVSILKSQKTNL